MTAEQNARDMLERMGVPDAQAYSAGDLVELANLIVSADTPVALAEAYRCGKEAGDAEIANLRQQLSEARSHPTIEACRQMIEAQAVKENEELHQQLAEARAEVEQAFREGFRSPATYNDVLVNDEDDEWENYKRRK